MKSVTTASFRKMFSVLPSNVQTQAKDAYLRFRDNPWHPGLQFKPVHSHRPIFSARININYRAVGIIDDDGVVWFWIGSHADYDNLLKHI